MTLNGDLRQMKNSDIIKKNTIDFLGVNYYHPKRVKTRTTPLGSDHWSPEKYYEEVTICLEMSKSIQGWEIYPKAIYDIAKMYRKTYGNIPWFLFLKMA